jgi:lipid-A-disaccharide synthase
MDDEKATMLLVAGEASGDLHGSKVAARLRELAPDLRLYGVGGDRMRSAGVEAVFRSEDFALVGFVEVLRHIPRLRVAMKDLVHLAAERRTRVAVLIDYPGFNLILARRLKALGIHVLYYVSPQVWAWGAGRVKKISERTDRVAVILPFEKQFFAERGVDVEYVGHPLLEEPALARLPEPKSACGAPLSVGLLPGSRTQEIARHLPPMLGALRLLRVEFPELPARLGLARGIDPAALLRFGDLSRLGVELVPAEGIYDLMRSSTALVVSSGTATLEAACLGTPMVIVYRMAGLSYVAGRALVRIPFIGLVNVVAGEKIVPELIQGDVTPGRIAREVRPFLSDPGLVGRTSRRLLGVRAALGAPGASDRVASMALQMMRS